MISDQSNSAGRPHSQSQMPTFESFRFITPNVFIEDDDKNDSPDINYNVFEKKKKKDQCLMLKAMKN